MLSLYYCTILLSILLFPWSLVGLMAVGALWERVKVRARGDR